MVYRVEGIVRDIHVADEQMCFTFNGAEQRVATKDFDATIREGDWAVITGGDNSLAVRPGEPLVSFIEVIRIPPPRFPPPSNDTATFDPTLFPLVADHNDSGGMGPAPTPLSVAGILQFLLAALLVIAAVGALIGGLAGGTGGVALIAFLILVGLGALHILLGVHLRRGRRAAIVGYLVLSICYTLPLAFFLANLLLRYRGHDKGQGVAVIGIALLVVLGINALTLPHLGQAG